MQVQWLTPLLPARQAAHGFGVLVRYRLRQAVNALDQQLREAPLRSFAVLVLLLVIWAGLYFLLKLIFYHVGRWELVAVVANRHIFTHFFLILAIMLCFSNAILAFGSLFGRQEAAHLLSLPVLPRQVLTLKWLEGMVLSSWSFLLLGVPLMLAVARNTTVPWYYYPLFAGHFLGFVLLPATLGLVVAWVLAQWVPRRPLGLGLFVLLGVGLVGLGLWNLKYQELSSQELLGVLLRELKLAKSRLLPSTWTAAGIVAAIEKRVGDSVLYLAVVLSNGAFISWLAINLLSRRWAEAYSRVQALMLPGQVRRGWLTAFVSRVLFFYLSRPLRLMLLKDLRGFVRDAAQWTQMGIMLGLLLVYALNLKRLPVDLDNPGVKGLIAFLNLTTVSLILATFTSRFVYPLLSLESQQLWLLSLLPTGRTTVLLLKFVFSLTITGLCGVGVMAVACRTLDLPSDWTQLSLLICFAICLGLSGLSVGLGARFPVLGQRNPARIAAGLGGTINLIASMGFVSIHVVAIAAAGTAQMQRLERFAVGSPLSEHMWNVGGGLLLFSVAAATAALVGGARHFERLEY
jgi:ABC-2 type transport system permease protein